MQDTDLTSPRVWLLIGCGIGLLLITFRHDTSARNPLIPASIAKNGPLMMASLVAASITFVTSATGTLMSFWLQDVDGMRPMAAGFTLMLMSVGVVVGSRLGSGAMDRFTRIRVIQLGLTGLAATTILFILGIEWHWLWLLAVSLLLSGIWLGWTSVATTAFGLSKLSEEMHGTGAGVLSAAAPIGTAVGIALVLTSASLGERFTHSTPRGMEIGLTITLLPLMVSLTLLTALARRTTAKE